MSALGLPFDKWRKFRQLSKRERATLTRSLVLLPLIALGLRLVRFRRLHAMLAKLSSDCEPAPGSAKDEVQLAVRMVEAASREGLVHGNCLEQSLTLWWLLRRRQIPAQLRIGVRKQADEFQAHAWVELEGAALNDRDDVHQEYTAFARDLGALEVGAR